MDKKENKQGKILVVDDDPFICQFLADAIRIEGYEPLISNDPDNALEISKGEIFGLSFIDINLPGMNGLDLASKLKEQDRNREIVFITGHGTFDSALRAIKIGAYDYLRKPFSIDEFNLCLKRYQLREELKEKIRLAEQRYFHLVQNIPLLIYVLCRDFRLDFINDACYEILGYTPDEALNDPKWLLGRIHPNDRARIKNLFQSAFEPEEKSFSVDCRFIHKKGHLVHTILKSIPDFQHNPDVNHLEGIIVDITDRVFLEKAVVQKEKIKTLGSISAEVAHEIRNPLVSIGGFARRLKKKNPELTESTIILNESIRLEKILDRIRDYLNPVEVRPQNISLNELITYCVELLSPEMKRNHVLYHLNLNPLLSTIYADKDILIQVFINLIRNAMKAMEKGGNLFIKTFENNQSLNVHFKNKTLNKKVEDPEKLFLPFDEGGQSIGLPLCYKLLRNMGGLLFFEQDQDYIVFTVSLPNTKSSILEPDK
ncbi:MAG: response regulator [Thermodesulfobacteriota bacterium]|nr:response regulator [Thermodesulfobacteriota bacterium]